MSAKPIRNVWVIKQSQRFALLPLVFEFVVWVIKQSKRFTLIPLVFELIDSLGRAEGHVNQLV